MAALPVLPLLLLLLAVSAARSAPSSDPANDLAIGFLTRYGYVDTGTGEALALRAGGKLSGPKLEEALKEVQRYGNIPQTGALDKETLQLMNSKRCGLPDVVKGRVEEGRHLSEESSEQDEEDVEQDSKEASEGDPEEESEGGTEGYTEGESADSEPSTEKPFKHSHHFHHHHGHHHHHHHHHRLKRAADSKIGGIIDLQSAVNETNAPSRKKRYILASRGWQRRNLKYHLTNWPDGMREGDVLYTMEAAFQAWAKHGGLGFKRTSDPKDADISLGFYSGQHGDMYPFDGRGSILAHAFFPGTTADLEGDVHFDADENWKLNTSPYERGVDLYTVALHELGHSLGLSHSPHDGSVMNPYYKGSSRDLGYDDILAMHVLYASRSLQDDNALDPRPRTTHYVPRRPPPTRPTTTETSSSERTTTRRPRPEGGGSWGGRKSSLGCYGQFDVVALIRNELFIIKDKMLWRLRGPGQVQPNYPVEFRRFFYKLPERVQRIDSIYQREHDSRIIMFTGAEYWVYDGTNFVDSPRSISEYGLPPDIKKIDAATSRNDTAILFAGETYWMFDDVKMSPVPDSPRPITDWGLSTSIDSALTYEGKTYFFKRDYFWIYDEKSRTLRYPPSRERASDYWLNC